MRMNYVWWILGAVCLIVCYYIYELIFHDLSGKNAVASLEIFLIIGQRHTYSTITSVYQKDNIAMHKIHLGDEGNNIYHTIIILGEDLLESYLELMVMNEQKLIGREDEINELYPKLQNLLYDLNTKYFCQFLPKNASHPWERTLESIYIYIYIYRLREYIPRSSQEWFGSNSSYHL